LSEGTPRILCWSTAASWLTKCTCIDWLVVSCRRRTEWEIRIFYLSWWQVTKLYKTKL